uniref:Uncharacterized protein n=1 Tax=Romanomermis culicivorax TaxID=13658 RepID=A0A915K8I9_ROMCU
MLKGFLGGAVAVPPLANVGVVIKAQALADARYHGTGAWDIPVTNTKIRKPTNLRKKDILTEKTTTT